MIRVILALLVALTGSPAAAQGVCVSAKHLSDFLRTKYGEVAVATGMSQSGVPVILTANVETGTWSLILRSPEAACVVMTGKDFEIIVRPTGKET